MCNGDRIRLMSNEELAVLFNEIISERDHYTMKKLLDAGIEAELIEFPIQSIQTHFDYLEQEVPEMK